jgi:hypothetical protein
MDNTGSIKKRLKEFIGYQRISVREFERRCGLGNSFVNNVGNTIGADKLENIIQQFPWLNRSWLILGEGNMLVEEKSTPEPQPTLAALPFFEDAEFGCSPSGFDGALTESKTTGHIMLPGLTADGDTFVVPARGDSMVNTANPERSIPNGALVAVRKTRLSTPRWGEVYALATADGCIIKRLYPSDRDGYVRCVSFNNEEFPPFELETREIYDIGNVVAVVSVKFWA